MRPSAESWEYTANIVLSGLTAGQFAIYGDLKKAMGAVGGVEIAK